MPGVTLRRLGEGSNDLRVDEEAPDTMDLLAPLEGLREIDGGLEPTTRREPIRREPIR